MLGCSHVRLCSRDHGAVDSQLTVHVHNSTLIDVHVCKCNCTSVRGFIEYFALCACHFPARRTLFVPSSRIQECAHV